MITINNNNSYIIACRNTINETKTLGTVMFGVFLPKSAAAPIQSIDLSLCRFFNLIFLVIFH